MKQFLIYITAITLTFFLPSSLSAAETEEQQLKALMTEKSDKLYSILNDQENDTETRKQKILDEVVPLFDFNLMARLALDKKTWKSLTNEQRESFSDLFVARIQNSYLSKLDLFTDTEVEVKDSVRVKKNRIQVAVLLKTKTDTKELLYKFYLTKAKKWLIYDVDVVGVSFLQSYRSQFSSFLKEHSFEELLAELKNDDDKQA